MPDTTLEQSAMTYLVDKTPLPNGGGFAIISDKDPDKTVIATAPHVSGAKIVANALNDYCGDTLKLAKAPTRKYRVLLQQYVEQTGVIEVEAETPEDAKDIALDRGPEADWGPGDDAGDVECYAVMDGDEMVWER